VRRNGQKWPSYPVSNSRRSRARRPFKCDRHRATSAIVAGVCCPRWVVSRNTPRYVCAAPMRLRRGWLAGRERSAASPPAPSPALLRDRVGGKGSIHHTAPMSRNSLTLLGITTGGLVVATDQLSKWWILNVVHLSDVGQIVLLPVLNFTMVWNRGVTFGL